MVSKPIVAATMQEVDVSIPASTAETLVEKVDETMTEPKQSETSHDATSKDNFVVTVHTTTFGPTHINYAPP